MLPNYFLIGVPSMSTYTFLKLYALSPPPSHLAIMAADQIPEKPWSLSGRGNIRTKTKAYVQGVGDLHDLFAVRAQNMMKGRCLFVPVNGLLQVRTTFVLE